MAQSYQTLKQEHCGYSSKGELKHQLIIGIASSEKIDNGKLDELVVLIAQKYFKLLYLVI